MHSSQKAVWQHGVSTASRRRTRSMGHKSSGGGPDPSASLLPVRLFVEACFCHCRLKNQLTISSLLGQSSLLVRYSHDKSSIRSQHSTPRTPFCAYWRVYRLEERPRDTRDSYESLPLHGGRIVVGRTVLNPVSFLTTSVTDVSDRRLLVGRHRIVEFTSAAPACCGRSTGATASRCARPALLLSAELRLTSGRPEESARDPQRKIHFSLHSHILLLLLPSLPTLLKERRHPLVRLRTPHRYFHPFLWLCFASIKPLRHTPVIASSESRPLVSLGSHGVPSVSLNSVRIVELIS